VIVVRVRGCGLYKGRVDGLKRAAAIPGPETVVLILILKRFGLYSFSDEWDVS
jgi:hypothetical protein